MTKTSWPAKKTIHLCLIAFSHLFSVFLSSFYDEVSHSKSIKITDPKYWLWFFSYWSAWTSLLTILWVLWTFYKLKKRKKQEETFFEQLVNCIVLQTNLVSGIVFCGGGFLMTFPRKNYLEQVKYLPFYYLFGTKITKLWVWLLYNFFWHFWAPLLVVVYFWRYCQGNWLVKKRKLSFYLNLLNPTVYFIYVLSRPKLLNFTTKFCSNGVSSQEPFHYPYDYPYPFFYWCAGERYSAASENSFLGFKWKPSFVSALIWTPIIIIFWWLVFSLLLYLIIVAKERKVKGSKITSKKISPPNLT